MKTKIIGILVAISSLVSGVEIIHIDSNRIFTLNQKELNKFSLDLKEENYLTVKIKYQTCRASILSQNGRQIGKTGNMSGEFNERVAKGKYYITVNPSSSCKKIEIFTPEFTHRDKSEELKKNPIIILSDKKGAKIDYKQKYEECMKNR